MDERLIKWMDLDDVQSTKSEHSLYISDKCALACSISYLFHGRQRVSSVEVYLLSSRSTHILFLPEIIISHPSRYEW